MKERINITLPLTLLQNIDKICKQQLLSRSAFVRTAIRFYIHSLEAKENKE